MSARPGPAKVRGGQIAAVLPVEVIEEARRLDWSVSWVMQRAWKIARPKLAKCAVRSP